VRDPRRTVHELQTVRRRVRLARPTKPSANPLAASGARSRCPRGRLDRRLPCLPGPQPMMSKAPSFALIRSLPLSPKSRSVPRPPVIVSSPPRPQITLSCTKARSTSARGDPYVVHRGCQLASPLHPGRCVRAMGAFAPAGPTRRFWRRRAGSCHPETSRPLACLAQCRIGVARRGFGRGAS
jgi:hypothetical protein